MYSSASPRPPPGINAEKSGMVVPAGFTQTGYSCGGLWLSGLIAFRCGFDGGFYLLPREILYLFSPMEVTAMDHARLEPIRFWIDGAPYSKANSRRLLTVRGPGGKRRTKSIKSENALAFVDSFRLQCPRLSPMFEADVHVDLDIYYPDRRRDMDESLVLDAMQGLIYSNDRLVKSRRCRWNLSKTSPGIDVHVRLAAPSDYADRASFPEGGK